MTESDSVASPLPAIRQRQQEATPGPWRYETDDEGSSMGWIMHEQSRLFDVFGDSAQQYINAEFAAHARSDIPWLLSEHDRLVEEVARLTADRDDWERTHAALARKFGDVERARDDNASLCERAREEVARLQAEREDMRIRAYRMARVFEPSMDGYRAAMATYAAAFGKPEGELSVILPDGSTKQAWEL